MVSPTAVNLENFIEIPTNHKIPLWICKSSFKFSNICTSTSAKHLRRSHFCSGLSVVVLTVPFKACSAPPVLTFFYDKHYILMGLRYKFFGGGVFYMKNIHDLYLHMLYNICNLYNILNFHTKYISFSPPKVWVCVCVICVHCFHVVSHHSFYQSISHKIYKHLVSLLYV